MHSPSKQHPTHGTFSRQARTQKPRSVVPGAASSVERCLAASGRPACAALLTDVSTAAVLTAVLTADVLTADVLTAVWTALLGVSTYHGQACAGIRDGGGLDDGRAACSIQQQQQEGPPLCMSAATLQQQRLQDGSAARCAGMQRPWWLPGSVCLLLPATAVTGWLVLLPVKLHTHLSCQSAQKQTGRTPRHQAGQQPAAHCRRCRRLHPCHPCHPCPDLPCVLLRSSSWLQGTTGRTEAAQSVARQASAQADAAKQ